MPLRPLSYLCCLLLAICPINAQESEVPQLTEEAPASQPPANLSYADAVILGVVEGITEYLPVSSTGHLILTNALLGLDADTPIYDKNGAPVLFADDKSDGQTQAYTIGQAAYAYVIVIQAGAIAAVIILYWSRILDILMGCLGKSATGRKLAVNLICAFLPAAIIGLLLDDWIEATLGSNVRAVAGALVVGAIVMLAVEHWRKHGQKGAIDPEDGPHLHSLTIRQSIIIGVCQCFAMWPGTSRSMATIVGGYLVGLSPKHAAEFSFLLGLITLSAASGYKLVSEGPKMLAVLEIGPILAGCVVAFVAAALAVKWLVTYLSRHGLVLFAWYRIALAIAVFLVLDH